MSLEPLQITQTEKDGERLALNAEHESLLISFCNQISSPNYSLCFLDPSNGVSRWINLADIPEILRKNFSGISGICCIGKAIVIATQGAAPALAYVSITEAKVTSHIVLEKSKDTHSLVFHNGYIYLVSTGTNEIYRVSFHDGQFGREELVWSYPDVSYDKDEIHLNGITIDEDSLIASCFGPKKADGSWGTKGRVFYLKSGHTIQGNLNQPHSPLVASGHLIFAESAAHRIHIYNKTKRDKWVVKKEIRLKGYARGIALKDKSLFVGISASRKVSRSKSKLLFDGKSELVDSSIIEIDLATGCQVDDVSLLGYGREAYDILLTRTHPTMLPASDVINTRVREMESSVDRYATDAGRLFLEKSEIIRNSSELVSVIIPTYNRSHLIGDSIHSVLVQTYSNLEVIVVDDGSTDNTEEVIAAISDTRLRYVRQPNCGRSNARNHALSLATGKYITFLDSDDLYLPNKVEMQVAFLNKHPGTGMVYTSAHCINDNGEMLAHKYIASVSGLIYENIAFFTPVTITLPTVMTYKKVLDHVSGFDENLHRLEDTDMWRRISKSYRIDAMPEYTCLLRTHDDNSLLNQNPDHIAAALEYYAAKILKEDLEVNISVRRKGLAGLYKYYGHAFLSIAQFSDTGKHLLHIANKYDTSSNKFLDRNSIFAHLARLIYYRCGLNVLLFWIGWSGRFVYYRSANIVYRIFNKVRCLLEKS